MVAPLVAAGARAAGTSAARSTAGRAATGSAGTVVEGAGGTGASEETGRARISQLQEAAFGRRLQKEQAEAQEVLEDTDVEEMLQNPPTSPGFPIIMMMVAGLKDFLDTLDLSLIGIILTTILSVILSLIMTIWTWNKISGGWWKKPMMRWIWSRFIFTMVAEFVPFLKILPANSIFIWMAHNKEKKLVRAINQALETLRRMGFGEGEI